MGFIGTYCMKFPNFGNFFNFFMFRFSPIKKKILMINYFCSKKLKANIIEIFCMQL